MILVSVEFWVRSLIGEASQLSFLNIKVKILPPIPQPKSAARGQERSPERIVSR